MKLFKKSIFVVAISMLFMFLLACSKSEEKKEVKGIDRSKEFITVATGPTSGIYFPIGGAFAEALKSAGYNTSSQATGASAENISMISKGEAEIAIAMQDSVMQAYKGFGAYEGKANPELTALMRLWPNYVQLVTLKKSGIKTVEDLKGKRVGVGAANSGVELNARMIYEAYGMTYADSKVDYLSYGEAIDQMKNGQCDAAFVTSGLPNGTIMELATSYDMEIVPIDGAGRDKLIEKYPFFSKTIVPANTYNNDKDVESVFVYNIMLVNSKLSDEMVYDMINVIFENIGTIKASHNAANKNIDMSFGVEDVRIPLHPGAAKFWQEKGFKTPNN
ncbi:MAG: TAXI family TRAP transporter solute-binding subunit [Fusobacterium sp.]|uniref:TAXI family TRAP transporter solute-binding subunit n=1 Tax=Fusobacterium sp. TaxID=68766 RepID=UPI0026DBB10F|nr:TAXI family TRAP transporter solute-binding subunit [Fusobacterium sp.]MDO4690019.1 TAXI family TRAP transporter solute-binding subunit [Fusobacterium sp.]